MKEKGGLGTSEPEARPGEGCEPRDRRGGLRTGTGTQMDTPLSRWRTRPCQGRARPRPLEPRGLPTRGVSARRGRRGAPGRPRARGRQSGP